MDKEKSLSDDATFAGDVKRGSASEASIGDERTIGDNRTGHDTVIDDIEVVDLEARYRVEGTLGQGGMGSVLLATDTRLDRKVAIKRILGEAAGNKMAVQRFLTEAKAIAAINHPNVVQIHDYGRANDGPFLIMEYVDGGSLLDRCRESALPLDQAIDLACQLCDGLAKAHDLGIIHRDIKPANVLLTNDGIPKLTDFGLAKAQAGDHGQTMTGAVLGTPDFMPPEQRRDAFLVDHRSDLWSLAATVYQMATGRSPKIIRFDLLPSELTKVLGKALEDAKDARYQSAREFRDALKASLRFSGPMAAEVVGEGQCLACGMENDSKRKFCRGCGASLEAPCLQCSAPMPIWEQICGSCGAKQSPLLESRKARMAKSQAQAEGLLRDFEFDRAAAIAAELCDETHPRLTHLKEWGGDFTATIKRAREEQYERTGSAVQEALAHEKSFDYPAAIRVLQPVPKALLDQSLPTLNTSAGIVLRRLERKLAQSLALDNEIRSAINSRSLEGLLDKVVALARLRPDRADITKLRVQLEERLQRGSARRDELREAAHAAFRKQDYKTARARLDEIDRELMTDELRTLSRDVDARMQRVTLLRDEIKAAVAEQQYDGLPEKVDEYLNLHPSSPDVEKLRSSLQKRTERLAAEKEAKDALAARQRAERVAELTARVADLQTQVDRRETIRHSAAFLVATLASIGMFAFCVLTTIWPAGDLSQEPRVDFRNICQAFFGGLFLGLFTWVATAIVVAIVVGVVFVLRATSRASSSHTSEAHSEHLPSLPDLENSTGIKMKQIPAGSFIMGDGGFQHNYRVVSLTQPYFIGVNEVTNAEWEKVMGNMPSDWKEGDRPVVQVSWDDAVMFCETLSALPEEKKAGRVYRLPTEAEWEYACRAGSTTTYSFGDDYKQLGEYGWFGIKNCFGGNTHPVGQKRPNAWGLYDMHGNVAEWCSDWHGDFGMDAATDPTGPHNGSERVIRGGNWCDFASACQAATREKNKPTHRSNGIGFRVAMTAATPRRLDAAGR